MTQKLIKIGSSAGVIIPKSELKRINATVGDEVEIIVKKPTKVTQSDIETLKTAEGILKRYHADFEALAER